ncbi:ORF6N domain-containing protein [Lactiplantibacillus plantarum]|uniref:ORF6N domain-containing protein n=1 Tax=Lactiplantibacillus plantarum TaxID=1590 RepID=UPI000DD3B3D7|nr:ORF6N domain-containing protein [Lactiplantibacillus plantarum]MCJ1648643.1 ORF6N domain-containing protein [Lactiplantibacillus plantarum subsp. plantarum]MDI5784214.1 ORF6N domain-containing protein [Lactiplantibacillus plantarum]
MNELKVIGHEHIGQYEFIGIEGGFGESKKAMLVKDIAKIHERPVFKINELINNNIKRFKEGIDLIDLKHILQKDVFSEYGFSKAQWGNAANIYLLSERGYSKLLKILEDDKAWEIYDELVDNYFNMRQSIKENQPSLVAGKRLEIMEKNAATRKANLLFKIAQATDSKTSSQSLLAQAAKELTGEMTIPVMKCKEYSASEVGNLVGKSANMVGRICNRLGLKAEQPGQNKYGRWSNSKSQHSDKEVPQWLYFDEGVEAIKNETDKHPA